MHSAPVVIVTGASRGLGREASLWLARAGAAVSITARNEKDLQTVAGEIREIGSEAFSLAGDVTDLEFCRRLVSGTHDRFGRLDGLINNAGIAQPIAALADADPEAWRYNIEVNLVSVFYLTQASLPALKANGGRVLNISTGAAVRAIPTWTAYCAAKAGQLHLTRTLAAEEPGITAIAMRPGVMDTEMQVVIRTEGAEAMPAQQTEYFRSLKTEGKLEPPAIPARSAAWLVLNAPSDWSGEFCEYDDPKVMGPARERFGEPA
jgi:NAD(P)-dependent dehydrogenase (short-subunit alcohol dehydrogenase family)